MPTNLTRNYQKEVVKIATLSACVDTHASNYSKLTTNIIFFPKELHCEYTDPLFLWTCVS
jgi:hypothetical protein